MFANLPRSIKNQSGQALLLVLLSMAVVLTIVLSILSRSVTDIAVTTKGEEALRAFSAAEAGIERAIIVGTDIGPTDIGDAQFTAQVTGYSSGSQEFSHPVGIISGESIVAWFVDHDTNGDLTCTTGNCFTGSQMRVCWGKEGTAQDSATTPALEVSVFYAQTPGDYSTIRIARQAVDPYATRRSANGFEAQDAGSCVVGGKTYAFQRLVDFAALGIPAASYGTADGLQFARLRLFYNTDITHELGVSVNFPGNSLLPAQGLGIESTGSSGEANRKIDVFQSFGEPPPIFDAVIFSPGGIVK